MGEANEQRIFSVSVLLCGRYMGCHAELTRVHSVHPVHFDGIFASKKGSEFQESEDSRSASRMGHLATLRTPARGEWLRGEPR